MGNDLAGKPATEREARALLARLKEQEERLRKVKNNGYRGSSHPLVQYSLEYGKQQHDSMGTCDVRDKAFPGSKERPDCVDVSACMVWDFKPKNDRAVRKGRRQLSGYLPAVVGYYQALLDQGAVAKDYLGGSVIMDKIREKCVRDSKVIF